MQVEVIRYFKEEALPSLCMASGRVGGESTLGNMESAIGQFRVSKPWTSLGLQLRMQTGDTIGKDVWLRLWRTLKPSMRCLISNRDPREGWRKIKISYIIAKSTNCVDLTLSLCFPPSLGTWAIC